ncbi:MAG: 16S rRNA (adenine(1518)-N(6)/adenine(1519)-N(6))-dimethyltransferase RsmA [Promethearchaeota archaeon]
MKKIDVKLTLRKLDIKPKKHLGQNFLIDNNIAQKMIIESQLTKDDIILEIGPGLGALTESLVERVKKVYAIEIESKFCEFLSNRFSKYNNIEIINADILKIDIPNCDKAVSNIPYSITGPLLEKVFFKPNPPQGILTVEKNIADRIFLKEDYKKFSRITISLNTFMEPIYRFNISRNCFYPIPKIDLTLIKIKPKENLNPFLLDNNNLNFFLKFVAGIMPYKNKNILNALKLFLKNDKEEISKILLKNNFENKKISSLNIEDFVRLSNLFINSKKIKKNSD